MWKDKHDYSSPDDPITIERNVLWVKYFVKGLAEGLPNWVWLVAFNALSKALKNWSDMKVMDIKGLQEAYDVGKRFGLELLGGD